MDLKGRTRRTPSAEAVAYQAMAEEFMAVAEECLEKGRMQAAGMNAVHAAISATDAVCVFELGERSASERHDDAPDLLRQTAAPGAGDKADQLSAVLGKKNLAEYESRPLLDADARTLVKRARRIVDWAGGVLRG